MSVEKRKRARLPAPSVEAAEILPPDPLIRSDRQVARMESNAPPRSEGEVAFRGGVSPKALRRRSNALINSAMPKLTQRAIDIANGDIECDERVSAVMLQCLLDRGLGKARDSDAADDEDGSSNRMVNMKYATPEQRARMNSLMNQVGALAAEIAAQAPVE